MINRRHRSERGAVLCGRADSIENRLEAHWVKKLTFSLRCGPNRLLLLLLAVSIGLAGCGLTSKATGPLTPTISVSIQQSPPSTLPVGGIVSVSATVSSDPANAGVDWIAMCGSAPLCGSFSPRHTASGAMAIFTAPLGVPSGKTVAVTALSTTDQSKASSATVTIMPTVTGVTITPPPPTSFPAGGSLSVAATVAGDPSNAGVDWKVACAAPGSAVAVDCSAAFPGVLHSPPGVATILFVPLPATYPTIVGSTVTLTAYATADHNFSASASFTVTTPISISVTQPLPANMLTKASSPVIAVVTNDPTNSGVTWTILSCDAAPCGSWSTNSQVLATTVASGAPATYTAPPTVPPSGVNHVMIIVAAVIAPSAAVASVEVSITAPISIAITQKVQNDTIVVNHTAQIAATVSNDAANAGVDWTVTCASAAGCGSFSPTHTASSATTTFTAPTAVPTGNTVTITAASTSDPTKTFSEIVTVTAGPPPDSLLNGQFVMSLNGRNANGGPFTLGGVIIGNGIGQVTGGSLDLVDVGGSLAGNTPVCLGSPCSYSIGSNGRGQITVTVDTALLGGSFGASGSIVLSVVFVTPQHALLSETDTFGSAIGTLDLQNATDLAAFRNKTSAPNGVYAINLTGNDLASPYPRYFLAGALTLSGFVETAYIADQSDKGVISSVPYHTTSHAFASPLPNSFGEMTLDSVNLGLSRTLSLNAWLIDANHFFVTDWRDPGFGVFPAFIGYMAAQPSSPALSGTYAFAELGATASPSSTPQAAGGIFTCGSSTGILDVTPLGGTPLNINAITAACIAPANGRGLITLSGTGTSGISQFAAYTTVDQGVYVIELDGGSLGSSGPSGAGAARRQTLSLPIAVSSFKGSYASNFLADTSLGFEGFAGQINSDGVSALSGTVDENSFNGAGAPSLNAALTGSFTAPPNGRFPLALTITPATGQPAPQFNHINPACYILDANTCLLLGLDATAPGTGILQLQNTGL